jgi:nucleoside phosphorylase
MTALGVEFDEVVKHLTGISDHVHPRGTRYKVGRFDGTHHTWKVAVAEIGPGDAGAAIEVERAVSHFSPDVALFVGVAGAIKDAQIGDVVVARRVYGYQSGKAGEEFYARPAVFPVAYRLEQLAYAVRRDAAWHLRAHADHCTPSVHVGPIAAGEVVVSSTKSELYGFIRENYNDALAVEMEGRGFLEAVHRNDDLPALVIRGISDRIHDKTAAADAANQPLAAAHAAAFAFELLAQLQITGRPAVAAQQTFLARGEFVELLRRQGRL